MTDERALAAAYEAYAECSPFEVRANSRGAKAKAIARAINSAIEAYLSVAQPVVPEDFVLVPREPTVGMFRALTQWATDSGEGRLFAAQWSVGHFREDYLAMLAASPAPQVQTPEGEPVINFENGPVTTRLALAGEPLIAAAERSLVRALHQAEAAAEDAVRRMHDESTEGHRLYYAASSRHGAALQAAEEAGYERGLADAHPPTGLDTGTIEAIRAEERERCAKVAEANVNELMASTADILGMRLGDQRREIAAAIRSLTPPTGGRT